MDDRSDGSPAGRAPVVDGDTAAEAGIPYRAIAVATGEDHACALLDDHRIKCWGGNAQGELGYGDTRTRGGSLADMGNALPTVDLGTGRTATAIAAGRYATCAILDDGSLKCWGRSVLAASAQDVGDGPGEMGDALKPLDLGGRKVLHVAMGRDQACASLDDDEIWCWGMFNYPTVELPTLTVAPAGHVKELSSGSEADILALYEDGSVTPVPANSTELAQLVPAGRKVLVITGAYQGYDCALLDDGSATCTFAMNNDLYAAPPDTVGFGVPEWYSNATATLSADGSVHSVACSGHANPSGYFCAGNGDTVNLGAPARALSSGGDGFTCAVLADGRLKCWIIGLDVSSTVVGATLDITRQSEGGIVYGFSSTVDLGAHP